MTITMLNGEILKPEIWSATKMLLISDLFARLLSVNSSMLSTQSSLLRNLPRISKTGFHFPPTCFLSSSLVFISLCYSVQLCPTLCNPHGLQHARLPCPSPTPAADSNSCPLSQWYPSTISSSVSPFSSCLQSFPAWGSFQMSQFFASSGQSIGASASALVLPMNI